jgi:hypothetical protein
MKSNNIKNDVVLVNLILDTLYIKGMQVRLLTTFAYLKTAIRIHLHVQIAKSSGYYILTFLFLVADFDTK